MISGAAFCPHPPVLVPALASGAAPELAQLRGACRTAITRIASLSDRLVLLGSADRTFTYPPSAVGSFAGFGARVDVRLDAGSDGPGTSPELPLSLAVGAELVEDAIGDALRRDAVSVAPGADADAVVTLRELTAKGRVGLLVMGDGSARRSTAAPGYLDQRAVAFDDAVAHALRSGDAYGLEDVDTDLARELLAAGAPAWRTAGTLLRNARFEADLLAYDAPFGVAYLVATWVARV